MGAEQMQSLTLAQAVARQERMAVPLRPATLHPRYVSADAVRNPMLQPIYLCFEAEGECWMHSLHLTDIPGTSRRDASSPYGYGGPLSSTGDPLFLAAAWRAYAGWMREQRVAVEYVRFHPMLCNERHYRGGHIADNRQVVWVDLDAGDIAANYAVRLRQTLKKAVGAGLVYEETAFAPHAGKFARYYRAAMHEMRADPFYLFDDEYFERMAMTGLARLGICRHAGSACEWLTACLFLDSHGLREYHLAATNNEGRRAGASSFALHEAALAARSQGMHQLYLGGGTDGNPGDPLLFFKSSFSPRRLTYRTGWTVFDPPGYDELKDRFAAERAAHPERPIFYRKV
jgi:hypothetical protein